MRICELLPKRRRVPRKFCQSLELTRAHFQQEGAARGMARTRGSRKARRRAGSRNLSPLTGCSCAGRSSLVTSMGAGTAAVAGTETRGKEKIWVETNTDWQQVIGSKLASPFPWQGPDRPPSTRVSPASRHHRRVSLTTRFRQAA